jgi:hypothetical protein
VATLSFVKKHLPSLLIALVVLTIGSCETDKLPIEFLTNKLCVASYDYGYTDKMSYSPGDMVRAFLQSKDNINLCRLDVYNLHGDPAFSIETPLVVQHIAPDWPSRNGYGFNPTVDFKIPADLKSGVYLIEHQTPLIVKPKGPVDVLVIYPSNTANAYCTSGGQGLYSIEDKPSYVSFHRPIYLQSQAASGLTWFTNLTNFKIGFACDSDLDDYGRISGHKVIAIIGHSEYWTRKARENFDRFVDEGGSALVLSGNTMWWQVRYSPESDKMIRYIDPSQDPEPNVLMKTVNWTDPSLQFPILPSIGADFPHGGYGLKADAGWNGFKIVSPRSPLLAGTGLGKGDIIRLPSGEYDGAPIKSFDSNGYPELDLNALNFYKTELIGFDRGSRFDLETIGTFIVFKKTVKSGVVVNAASYDWCSDAGIGGQDGGLISKITINAITKLVQKEWIFSD